MRTFRRFFIVGIIIGVISTMTEKSPCSGLLLFLREKCKPYYEKEEEIRSGRILSGHEPIKFG